MAMEWLSDSVISAVTGVGSAVATGVGGYFVAKRQSKTSERELLSKDERAFRDALKEELNKYREEVINLRKEIMQLMEMNMKLETENKILMSKMDVLRKELREFRNKNE